MVRSALLATLLLAGCACGDRTHILLRGTGSDGRPCDADFECGIGAYCDDGRCAHDCEQAGDDCGPGAFCDLHGQCQDIRDGGNPPPPDDGGCPGIDLDLTPTIPTVVLLLDQSGSMTEDFGGIPRWDAMVQALVDPATGVVTTLESTVRFGATLYTSHDGGADCPILTEVPPAMGNFVAIRDMLAADAPDTDTPTGDAIDGVVAGMSALDPALAPFYIVLATDGEPDSCEIPNPQTGQAEAIAAAQGAFAAGIHLYILGVGSDVGAPHLQDMANAGAGLAVGGGVNEPYFTASDPASLADSFGDIIRGVRTCVFALSGAVDPEHACEGTVTLNGADLGCEDANGWHLVDETTIELRGTACDTALNAAEVHLTAEFPCGAIIK